MKKILCALLSLLLLLGLLACSTTPDVTNPTNDYTTQTDVPETTEPITTPTESEPEDTEATETLPNDFVPSPGYYSHDVYIPNATVDGFITEHMGYEYKYTEVDVLNSLKFFEVLSPETKINNFAIKDGVIIIDFNQAFADTVCAMGTSGETMVVGSVVNTFLNAFDCSALRFTVDGEVLESGHVIYDFDLQFFEITPAG